MFSQYQQPILISLSPNTENDDVLLALKLLFQPWLWKRGYAVHQLKENLAQYLAVKHATCFNSGRTAFWAILKAMEIESGNEIFIQAFTCNAVVNPVKEAGLKAVFVDIDPATLNLDPGDLEQKIITSTKPAIVVVQHTFGLPADLDKITEICQKYNLILLEDCAHGLGASFQNKKLGSLGKAAFFSFGRDKVISSVFGGAAVTNDEELAKKIETVRRSLAKPSCLWIFQQLLHPVLSNFLVIPLYNLGDLGKWILILLQKLGLLSKAVKNEEKQGLPTKNFAKKMPDALAILALNQFKKLDKILTHQREIAGFYQKNVQNPDLLLPADVPGRIYMRYPLLAKTMETDKILDTARKHKIFLDDGWRKAAIVPPDTNQEKMGYREGECPKAEKTAKTILNLPTHINITKEKAQKIVDFLNDYHGD